MNYKAIALFAVFLFALIVALPVQAQVAVEEINHKTYPLEPGGGVAMVQSASAQAALGDGSIVFKFKLSDVDPIADDASDVTITCILIQNLGTATFDDIAQIMILDQDGNAVAKIGVPADAGATPPTGCSGMAATGPNAQIQFETFFDLTGDLGDFVIPDDGSEIFQVAVRTKSSSELTDDSQNHTVMLQAVVQLTETVGSPPFLTTFIAPTVMDSMPDVIWNGGINSFTEDTWTVNPLMPGESGVVSRFTVCDYDSNAHELVLDRFFVKQHEDGTANSSDIVSLTLFRVEGFTRTLVASRTPDSTFDRGSGVAGGLSLPNSNTAIIVPDDKCVTFELEAKVSPFAVKMHTIKLRIQISAQEPRFAVVHQSVDPEIMTSVATMIGKGALIIPDTKLTGRLDNIGIIPINVAGVQLPGLGTLQVGPNGKLQYDPRVINIKEIVGVGPYIVSATEIDNRRGEARFTVQIDPAFDEDGDGILDNSLLTGVQDGTIANLVIESVGDPGDRTRLVLTFDCFELVDQNNCIPTGFPNQDVANQNPNNDIVVSAGEVTLLYPGDVDMDGAPTIRDSLKLANAILSCTFDLGGTQTSSTNGFSTFLEDVIWTNGINVLISGNDLTKNAGATAFNAGAISVQAITFGDGFVETTVNETNTDRLFGLSNGNTDEDDDDIDFAIFLLSNGTLEVRENGTQLLPNPAISYLSGDVLRVEIDGDDVLYKRNGTTFFASFNVISSLSFPLLVDTSLEDLNATLEDVQVRSLSSSFDDDADGVLSDLTEEQRRVADVVEPFAATGEIPGCDDLTSADVAEIARLAINFGTTPAPVALAASVATIQTDRPWYSFLVDAWNWATGTTQSGFNLAQVDLNFNAATQSFDVGVNDVPGAALGGIQGRVYFDPTTMQVQNVSGINGYNVLAAKVDNSLGEVRFVVLAPKGQGKYAGNILRLNVNAKSQTLAPTLSVEAFIDEDALDIPFTMAQKRGFATSPVALSLSGVQALSQGNGGYRFQVQGTGIAGIQVQVYDLAGGKLFDQETAGNTLSFQPLTTTGQPFANGVYLYVITAKGFQGERIRSNVNKLAILR